MWCGRKTTEERDKEGREHIFPEAIGGTKTLPIGDVCRECNNELGKLDYALKKGHPAMMHAYQIDPNIKGKKRSGKKGKEVKQRRLREKTHIEGKHSTRIERNLNSTIFINASFSKYSDSFSRALHKCIANIICGEHGSNFVRKNCKELLEFVKNGGDGRPWSYAISYSGLFNKLLIEPTPTKYAAIKTGNTIKYIVSFIHTSGIWIVGSHPFLLNKEIIIKLSASLLNNTSLLQQFGKTYKTEITKYYGTTAFLEERELLSELKFEWVIKEIEGKRNPEDSFYLLTKCRLCGQTNPTGMMIAKESVFNGDCNNKITYPENTWNYYSEKDLKKRGLKIEKWDPKSLKKMKNHAISIPIENDVKKMNIKNCQCRCINCVELIKYDAEDCFI